MRNEFIDIYKFILCFYIVLFHYYSKNYSFFGSGFVAVEIFMIIAGFYFFKNFFEKSRKYNIYTYMRNRFFRIFPYTLLAFIINYIIYTYIHNINVFEFICQKPYLIFEVSLLSMIGLNNNQNLLNAPTWNISALLIVEFIIMSLLINYRKKFLKIIIPFSIIFLIGTIANYKSIPPPRTHGI